MLQVEVPGGQKFGGRQEFLRAASKTVRQVSVGGAVGVEARGDRDRSGLRSLSGVLWAWHTTGSLYSFVYLAMIYWPPALDQAFRTPGTRETSSCPGFLWGVGDR